MHLVSRWTPWAQHCVSVIQGREESRLDSPATHPASSLSSASHLPTSPLELKFASLDFHLADECWEHKYLLRGDRCLRIMLPNLVGSLPTCLRAGRSGTEPRVREEDKERGLMSEVARWGGGQGKPRGGSGQRK